ncbi:hypothetical protein SAMN04488033_13828, partial [Salegentibacter agarivorans]
SLVPSTSKDVYLETMETHPHERKDAYQAWPEQVESVGICQHEEKSLAYRQQLYPHKDHHHAQTETGWLPFSAGLLF